MQHADPMNCNAKMQHCLIAPKVLKTKMLCCPSIIINRQFSPLSIVSLQQNLAITRTNRTEAKLLHSRK